MHGNCSSLSTGIKEASITHYQVVKEQKQPSSFALFSNGLLHDHLVDFSSISAVVNQASIVFWPFPPKSFFDLPKRIKSDSTNHRTFMASALSFCRPDWQRSSSKTRITLPCEALSCPARNPLSHVSPESSRSLLVISRKFFSTLWRTLAVSATLGLAPTLSVAAEHPRIEPQEGWISLFNGQDTSAFVTVSQDGAPADPKSWVVEDEALTRKGKAYLRTKDQYRDLILDLEFKVGPPHGKRRTNSGIFLRHKPDPVLVQQKKKYWWNGLLEIQLFDSFGLEPDKHQCGALYDMIAPSKITNKPPGKWNRMTITAKGPKITVVLNGEQVLDANLNDWSETGKNPDGTANKYHKPMNWLADQSGYIWLQEHPGEIWFRNIWVKSLD
jgi:3-keto-disaccharide hydrolase